MTHLSISHRSPRLRVALAALLAFCSVLVLHLLLDDGKRMPRATPAYDGLARPTAGTDAEIRRLQHEVRAGAPLEAQLAAAYLQKVRETGDPGFYVRADAVLRRALARGPEDPAELVEAATLAAGRHDFRAALRLAERAHALEPGALAPYPVLVDALVELGRYGAAERALQRMVDLRPALPAYARVSYFRELYGDLDGAARVMARAVAAGGPVPENVAYVRTLLGDLELARGRTAAARQAYGAALAAMPGYAPAAAGRARLAAAEGDLPGAIARWRDIVARLPLPEYVIALGETELAAGRREAARRDLALVRAERALLARAGVNTAGEFAIYEADYGVRRRAVALARAAWENAPSVRSADALGWALTRAGRPRAGLRWAHRALRLGSLDPALRYHAGMAALAAGRRAEGRRDLRLALAHGLDAQPMHARRAREALR
jgi:tetratricopeptide (TPR) repeat protein